LSQERLSRFAMTRLESERLKVLKAAGAESSWTDAIEIDTVALVEACLILQSAFARHLVK
jgi:hypothetical protein